MAKHLSQSYREELQKITGSTSNYPSDLRTARYGDGRVSTETQALNAIAGNQANKDSDTYAAFEASRGQTDKYPLTEGKRNLYEGGFYLLQDRFDTALSAGAVNGTNAEPTGGARTVVDTNNKISITAGVLSFATGEAANDGVTYPAQTRATGRMLLIDMVSPDSSVANINVGGTIDLFRVNGGGANVMNIVANNTSSVNVGAFVVSTAYKLAIIFRAAGTFYFIKGGAFTNWTQVWSYNQGAAGFTPRLLSVSTTVVATVDNVRIPTNLFLPTPLAYDTFTRANGAIGSTEIVGPDSQGVPSLVWTGSTWTIASNVAVNTPATLGAELLTNGDFTTDTTGWAANASATLSSVAGGQSGNALQVLNGAASNGYASQQIVTVVGEWYMLDFYLKNGLTSGIIALGTALGGSQYFSHSEGSASIVHKKKSINVTTTATFLKLGTNSAVLNDTVLYDSVSIKKLTLSELLASISTSTKDVIADVNVTMDTNARGTQAGVIINLDSASSPANFVLAFIDRDSAKLFKYVAGVYTSVISAAITYSAGATLRVIKDGTSYQLFYNNSKVGSTSTISDAGIISNTLHGLFSTDALNSLDNFLVFPRGVDNNYAILDSY